VVSSSIQPFGHNRHGPKTGGCAHFRRELRSHLTQRRLGRGLPPYQVASCSIQQFHYNRPGPPLWGGGAGSPSNTKLHGPRPTSILSGTLIHAAIWPQQIWAENWGVVPLAKGDLGPYLTQCGQGRGLPAKFHLDPSNRLATVHQRHRQDRTGEDRHDNGPITEGEQFYKRSPKKQHGICHKLEIS